MLTGSGLEVHDLGKDIPITDFIEKAKEVKTDIIGASALMTTTMGGQEQLIDELKRLNLPTPMEVKWRLEIADGALEMSREAANELVKKIEVPREKLEVQLKGKSFPESFDLNKLTPNKEYLDLYTSAKNTLVDLGFNFS